VMAGRNDLLFKIGADTTGVKKGLKDTSRSINKVSRQLNQNERTWQSWSIRSVAATVALGMAVGAVARKTVEYADAFQSITNKLKIATDGTKELTDVTEQMFAMASENRSSIETTVDLYTKMERSTRELGFSSAKLADITDLVGKAFVVGGATSKEMDGAIRQMGQSLSLGALRGEEFNSVAEQAPVIMEAMKAATGKNAGELRKLAATGAITSKILIGSIEAYSDKIRSDFAKTQATYGGKMEIARNKAIEFVGANEQIKNIVNSAGDSIVYLSENIDTLITAVQIAASVYGSTLVAAMGRAAIAKHANIVATERQIVATGAEAKASIPLLVAKERELIANQAAIKQKIILADAAVQKARSDSAAAIAEAKLNALKVKSIELDNARAVSLGRIVAAQTTATAATNAATGAMARATVAAKGLWMAMGGWVTVTLAATYAVYKYVSQQGEMNDALNQTEAGINNLREATDRLTEAQRNASMETAIAHQKTFTDAIFEQKKAIEDVIEVARKRGTSITPEEQKAIAAASAEITRLTAKLKIAQGSANNMFGEGFQKRLQQAKEKIFDIDAKAAAAKFEKANAKIVATLDERLKTETQKINSQYAKEEQAVLSHYATLMAAAKDDANKQAALVIERDTKLDSLQKEKIQKEYDLAVDRQKKLDALRKEQEGKDKYIQEITDRFKTEEALEDARYEAERKRFIEAAGGELELTAAHQQTLRDMQQEHENKIKEIKGQETFLDELAERFASEAELVDMKLTTDLERLDAHYANMKTKDQEYYDWKKQLEDQADNDRALAVARTNAVEMQGKIAMAQGILNIGKAFGIKNKKAQKALFLVEKGIAISRAVVATNLAAAQALASLPYPANLAAVAQVKVMGAMNIAAIAASAIGGLRSMGGGGGGSRSSVSAGSSSGGVSRGYSSSSSSQATSPRTISINMEGSALFSADQVRELIEQINEQVGDGVALSTGG